MGYMVFKTWVLCLRSKSTLGILAIENEKVLNFRGILRLWMLGPGRFFRGRYQLFHLQQAFLTPPPNHAATLISAGPGRWAGAGPPSPVKEILPPGAFYACARPIRFASSNRRCRSALDRMDRSSPGLAATGTRRGCRCATAPTQWLRPPCPPSTAI